LAERLLGAEIIQKALYSGYLKVHHGLKLLKVVFPNGIIAYLYPSARNHCSLGEWQLMHMSLL